MRGAYYVKRTKYVIHYWRYRKRYSNWIIRYLPVYLSIYYYPFSLSILLKVPWIYRQFALCTKRFHRCYRYVSHQVKPFSGHLPACQDICSSLAPRLTCWKGWNVEEVLFYLFDSLLTDGTVATISVKWLSFSLNSKLNTVFTYTENSW